MKHLSRLMLLGIISVLSFSSCSKDNDEPSSLPENFKSEYTVDDLYFWDAVSPVNGKASDYNTKSKATNSCKNCPSFGDILNYLHAGVYLDDDEPGEGKQTYLIDGEEHHGGLWLKKKSAIGSEWKDGITPNNTCGYVNYVTPVMINDENAYIRNSGNYFFLPGIGGIDSSFDPPFHLEEDLVGIQGSYWSSTICDADEDENVLKSYVLFFNSMEISVESSDRLYGSLTWRSE